MVILFNAKIRRHRERSNMQMEDYEIDGDIQGHHVYKSTWTPVIRHMLDVRAESAKPGQIRTLFPLWRAICLGTTLKSHGTSYSMMGN